MLTVYVRTDKGLAAAPDPVAAVKTGAAVWIDMLRPDETEERLVEGFFGIDIPTDADRAAMEESARFYEDGEALVLTATLVARRDRELPQAGGVSFILANGRLATVRKIEPHAMQIGAGRASARVGTATDGAGVLMALLEGVIERLADVLNEISERAHELSRSVFADGDRTHLDMRPSINELGRIGALCTKARDSLASLERLFAFAGHVCERHGLPGQRLTALARDGEQLDHAADGLQEHLTFLLDAALGLVTAGQNVAIQRLSVAAMAFVPSTLIASIFGMNFEAMTWFKAPWGPFAAFAMMMGSAGATLAFARWRKWF
jgi:magnesium transporter